MSLIGFGDRRRARELLHVRARSFAARIDAAPLDVPGRWVEIAGAFAFDWGDYRCVHDFGPEALRKLGELLDWFGDGPAPMFESDCGETLAQIGEALTVLGYRPCHAHALYAGELAELELAPAADAAALELSSDPRDFGRLGAQLWSAGDPERARTLTREHSSSNWRCTTVLVDGRPVAGASLFFDGELGYHANALTLPEHRGRGLHARLLREQIALARERGSRWFVADTQVGSGSGRNLERAGLRCVAACLAWRPRQDG